MAVEIGKWHIEFRPWGWVRLREMGGGPAVYLQYDLSKTGPHTRLDLQSVVMKAGEGDDVLSARSWRRIPFSKVEIYLTLTNAGDIITAPCEVEAPSLEVLDRYFDQTKQFGTFSVREPSDRLVSDDADNEPSRPMPQVRPPGGRLTDDFLEEVADAYRWFTEARRPPAPAIAETADVPVRTVHRWVYEARKRGILPPARAGRAG
ncbi:hypothetical protein [Streptomyces antibioticus]|uniref:hypothetical protein n=1 Tax=Streptomyces antibioticus TaxID=1890 RepID=UPI0036DB570B